MAPVVAMIPEDRDKCKTESGCACIPNCNINRGSKFKYQQNETKSEYQAAFKRWPFQTKRETFKPIPTKDGQTIMECQTIYRQDYVKHKTPKRVERKVFHSKVSPGQLNRKSTYMEDYDSKLDYNRNMKTKFVGQSIYKSAYQPYEREAVKKCRPDKIKPRSNLNNRPELEFTATSTFREDFQSPPPTERTKPIRPKERSTKAEETNEDKTAAKENISEKPVTPNQPPKETKPTKIESEPKFQGMTTFMADFKPHLDARRVPCCRPREADHSSSVPFDAETTQSTAYRPWPVSKPEKPKWAKKPAYVHPNCPLAMNSTYQVDFIVPGTMTTRKPFRPDHDKEDIIKHDRGDATNKFRGYTTYQKNYKAEGAPCPAQSYKKTMIYEPPKETIEVESTHRAHYKGEKNERARLCRHISEHRGLNTNRNMYFNTTYNDTYTNQYRPKSCPTSRLEGKDNSPVQSRTSVTPTPKSQPDTTTKVQPKSQSDTAAECQSKSQSEATSKSQPKSQSDTSAQCKCKSEEKNKPAEKPPVSCKSPTNCKLHGGKSIVIVPAHSTEECLDLREQKMKITEVCKKEE